jgi:hypothetical protein
VASKRLCAYQHPDGRPCGAPPLRDRLYCLFHDPEHAEAVAQARQLAGQRRRKDATIATVYDLLDPTSDEGTKRLMEIVVTDVLGLDNSLNRARVLLYAIQTSIKVRESGDLVGRLEALEATVMRDGRGNAPFEEIDDLEEP